MGNPDLKHSRARSGGLRWAASPKRFAPLRKVVNPLHEIEYTSPRVGTILLPAVLLECGHTPARPRDMIGNRYPERMRCLDCLTDVKGKSDE